MSGWGYPIQSWMGVPHPMSGWGYPRVPPGVPPTFTWDGVPPISWMGYPSHLDWDGVPHLDLGWEHPPPRPGMGYPPSAGWGTPTWTGDRGTPPVVVWMGHPPKCEQTDTCENSTFPRTSYAGGNKGYFKEESDIRHS